jgi:phosphate transport system substrate-binding protein
MKRIFRKTLDILFPEFKRIREIGALVTALALAVSGPAFAAQNITVKGSDTIVILGQKWAEKYMETNPEVAIQVTGGGSGTGIAALLNGTTDLANASRAIKDKEVEKAKAAGYYPEEFRVALDAIAVVVHSSNPVNDLTVKQIMGIYTGRINNWQEVGGENKPIIRYSRESSSGTYQFVKENVLKNQDYAADCQTMPGTSAVVNAVSKDPGGIGYGGAAYFLNQPGLKFLSVKEKDNSPAVNPATPDGRVNYAAVYDKSYPIWRYLFMYAGFRPKGAIKAYMDWILSPEGQAIVEEMGFIPLRTNG